MGQSSQSYFSFLLSRVLLIAIIIAITKAEIKVTISCQAREDPALNYTDGGQPNSCYLITKNSAGGVEQYRQKVCGWNNCLIKNKFDVTFASCKYDYKGQSCESQVCILPPSVGCTQTYFGQENCEKDYAQSWTKVSCGLCNLNVSCYSCRFTQTFNSVTTEEACLGSSCKGIHSLNITYQNCSSQKDSNQNPCNCCYRYDEQVVNVGSVCTSSHPLFRSDQLKAFVKSEANYEQQKRIVGLLIITLVFLVLYD